LIRHAFSRIRIVGIVTDIDAITDPRSLEDWKTGPGYHSRLIGIGFRVSTDHTPVFDYEGAVHYSRALAFESPDHQRRPEPANSVARDR